MKLYLPEMDRNCILTSELKIAYNSHDNTFHQYDEISRNLSLFRISKIWSPDHKSYRLVKWDEEKINYYYGYYNSKITPEEKVEMYDSIENIDFVITLPIGTKFKFSKIEYSLRKRTTSANIDIKNLDKDYNISEGIDAYGEKIKPYLFNIFVNSKFINNIEFEYLD
jgi:hypothetical protein